MSPEAAEAAARLLVGAHRGEGLLGRLPVSCRPATVEDAYAIQDAVTRHLGPIGGWKVGQGGPDLPPSCAPLYAHLIQQPGVVEAARHNGLGLEVEFAFRLRADLPVRSIPYAYDEVAAAIDFVPLMEIIGGRFRDRADPSPEEHLADGNANGAVIVGPPVAHWRDLDFRTQRVTLTIDGQIAQDAVGTHPAGDPVTLVVWQANHLMTRAGGLRAGDIVTTGSLKGVTLAQAPGRAVGDWGPGGRIEISLR